MDLESGDIVYIEALTDRGVKLEIQRDKRVIATRLTIEEARMMAKALLAAVVEADYYSRSH